MLQMMAPNLIVCLYSESDVIFERIKNNPHGRLMQNIESVQMGQFLQMSLALHYGILSNAEIYFINSQQESRTIAKQLVDILTG